MIIEILLGIIILWILIIILPGKLLSLISDITATAIVSIVVVGIMLLATLFFK